MHRSGTSALTRTVNLLGAATPQTLMGATSNNLRGHWESKPIVDLNDEILAACGHRWYSRKRITVCPSDVVRARGMWSRLRDTLESEFGGASTVVLKDPRISRLVPLYREVLDELGYATEAVLTLRNPLEVAQSLARRDQMEPRRAIGVWMRYTLDAERGTRGLPRALVVYEELLADWRAATRRMKQHLGSSWPEVTEEAAAAIDAFLTPDLRHHTIELPGAGFGRAAIAGLLYRDMAQALTERPAASPGLIASALAELSLRTGSASSGLVAHNAAR
ncbi:sulfotransferase family protein [Ancylobacter polymorphus]|uniref:Sulfotransferase family protein n=1 Tax=Ancylobacter polymorphus TaxID=223390 RepID=A0A9E7A3H5_9HYPH|nr:sulfotransferase family protein [Ancylobacter polymorphus]UOK70024.1 sulfotransferase family protein [Ancylobacter polymorphus]